MQITKPNVCDTSKGSLYRHIKPPLVGAHAFSLMDFVCESTHVTLHCLHLQKEISRTDGNGIHTCIHTCLEIPGKNELFVWRVIVNVFLSSANFQKINFFSEKSF